MKPLFEKVKLVDTPRRRLLQLAAVSIGAFALPACRNDKPAGSAQGDRFPEIVLPGLDSQVTPSGTYHDVTLVVNFWATWCEPCRREMQSLEKLSTLFYPKDLLVIGISVDSDHNLAREFCLRYKLTIPMLSDSDQTLSNGALRILAFPTTYLLGRDRTIARIIVGARDWADAKMIGEIEESLAVRRKEQRTEL